MAVKSPGHFSPVLPNPCASAHWGWRETIPGASRNGCTYCIRL